jgi:hypothetical protein
MSDNINTRAPKLVGKSYFFTEPDKVIQSADQAFGPISTVVAENQPPSLELRFRLGAKMSLVNDEEKAKAFAICSGNVLVQPQTGNSNKVNLILRPTQQPFNGMPVKYFIYRGLDIAGLLTEVDIDGNMTSVLANEDASPFIQALRQDYESLNGTNESNTIPSSWIGFDLGSPPYTGLIDDLFFRVSPPSDDLDPVNAKNEELPFVKGGVHLGEFGGDFQLDIVLGSPDYKQVISSTGFYYDIDFARAAEGIIDIANCPPNYPVKAYREAILDFIDPAAFWGMHCSEGGEIMFVNQDGILQVTYGESAYSIISEILISNRLYIGIFTEFGRTYNYYFEDQFFRIDMVSRDENIQQLKDSYRYHLWPICIVSLSDDIQNNILFLSIYFASSKFNAVYQKVSLDQGDSLIQRFSDDIEEFENPTHFIIKLTNLESNDGFIVPSQLFILECLHQELGEIGGDLISENVLSRLSMFFPACLPQARLQSSQVEYSNVIQQDKLLSNLNGDLLLCQSRCFNFLKNESDFSIDSNGILFIQNSAYKVYSKLSGSIGHLSFIKEQRTYSSENSRTAHRFYDKYLNHKSIELDVGAKIKNISFEYSNLFDLTLQTVCLSRIEYQNILETIVSQELINAWLINSDPKKNLDQRGRSFLSSSLFLLAENSSGKMIVIQLVRRIILFSIDGQNYFSKDCPITIN